MKDRNATEPPRILLVDDEEIVLVALRDLLRQQGYAVLTASAVLQAMTLLNQHAFAVVITDQQMPQLTGLEFLAEVKRCQPDSSRLLMTGAVDFSSVIDGINKAELFRFVLKPWHREDLLRTVAEAVQRNQTLVGLRRELETLRAENLGLVRRLASVLDR